MRFVAPFSARLSYLICISVTAFLFASGGMADQSARLLGILTIDLELKQFGISRLERLVFVTCLGIAIGVLGNICQKWHLHGGS